MGTSKVVVTYILVTRHIQNLAKKSWTHFKIKLKNFGHLRLSNSLNGTVLSDSYVPKRCRKNGKQCRTWFGSTLLAQTYLSKYLGSKQNRICKVTYLYDHLLSISLAYPSDTCVRYWCSVGQENPNSRVHWYSGKQGLPSFPLEQWTWGLEFSCQHWTWMIDSFSHIPSPNRFTNDSFSLFEHGSVRGKWENKNFQQSRTI